MSWPKWVLIGWLLFSVLVTIAMVGRPRRPIEPSTAVASTVLGGVLILLVVIS